MKRIKVKEAAELLGVSEQYIRLGMQRGQLPIGSCVKMSSRWTYHIVAGQLENYLMANKKAAQRQLDGSGIKEVPERT